MVARWSIPARASTRLRRSKPFRPRNARLSMACRRCSSPNSIIRISRASILARCAPASWRARLVRSRACGRASITRTSVKSPSATNAVSFQSAVNDPLERRVSTVGRIQPHLEVKIVDAEGRIVPRGQSGDLCTRGYSVMRGYWGDKEKSADVVDAAGWMHTGDLATLDAEGYCNIVGRIKDMVIRGGENLYPREIEEFLFSHPKIQDVQVFGVADQKYGEELCAWIRLREGETMSEDDVRDFCRGQIAHQKIPRYVEFVDEFPMTVTGKVQKFIMRQRVEERRGLKSAKTA